MHQDLAPLQGQGQRLALHRHMLGGQPGSAAARLQFEIPMSAGVNFVILLHLSFLSLCIFNVHKSHQLASAWKSDEHAGRTTLVLTRGSATASYVPFIMPYCSAMLSAVMTWVADSPLLRSQACARNTSLAWNVCMRRYDIEPTV